MSRTSQKISMEETQDMWRKSHCKRVSPVAGVLGPRGQQILGIVEYRITCSVYMHIYVYNLFCPNVTLSAPGNGIAPAHPSWQLPFSSVLSSPVQVPIRSSHRSGTSAFSWGWNNLWCHFSPREEQHKRDKGNEVELKFNSLLSAPNTLSRGHNSCSKSELWPSETWIHFLFSAFILSFYPQVLIHGPFLDHHPVSRTLLELISWGSQTGMVKLEDR